MSILLSGLILSISGAMGAMGRRIAGGLFEQWTGFKWGQPTRLFFGFMLALAAFISGAPFWTAMILVPLVWVGTTLGLFGGLGMGRAGIPVHPSLTSRRYLRDFGAMTLHGTLSIILPSIWAWYFGYAILPVVISGVIIGFCYEAAYRIIGINPPPHAFTKEAWPRGYNHSPDFGELVWGAARGIGMSLSVLMGA